MIHIGKRKIDKDLIKYTTAVIVTIVGLGLCIYGTVTEPLGVLDGSIITLIGLILSFTSATFSIHDYYKHQTAKFHNTIQEEYKKLNNKTE